MAWRTSDAEIPPHVIRLPDHVETAHPRASAGWLQQGGQYPDGRGLTGAVRTEQAEDGSWLDLQIQPVQSVRVTVTLHQTFDSNCWLHSGTTSSCVPRESACAGNTVVVMMCCVAFVCCAAGRAREPQVVLLRVQSA